MSDDPLDRRFKASEGTRTPDPLITNQPLYLLSYAGVPSTEKPPFPSRSHGSTIEELKKIKVFSSSSKLFFFRGLI